MNFINEIWDSNYKFQKDLDIERKGGYTPTEPEALFWDWEKNVGAVIEIKSFAYVTDEISSSLQHKINTIHFWMTKHLKKNLLVSNESVKFICMINVHNDSFNPNIVIRDLEKEDDLFSGFSSEYVTVRLYRLFEGEKIADLGISFYELTGKDLYFIQKYGFEWELKSTINLAKNYKIFSDRLIGEWRKKEWNKKFGKYSQYNKILFIDVQFRSPLGIAYVTGDFQLHDFVKCFADENIPKYPMLFDLIDEIFFKAEDYVIRLKMNHSNL